MDGLTEQTDQYADQDGYLQLFFYCQPETRVIYFAVGPIALCSFVRDVRETELGFAQNRNHPCARKALVRDRRITSGA